MLTTWQIASKPNLWTFPTQFDNAAWIKDGSATVTPNATTAPDGTLTADRVVSANGITSSQGLKRAPAYPLAATTFAHSIYLKGDGGIFPWVEFTTVASVVSRTWFNTQTGAFGTVGHSGVRIETLENSWYRIFDLRATSVGASSGEFYVSIRSANGSTANITGDGVSGYFAWGAKQEQGSSSTRFSV